LGEQRGRAGDRVDQGQITSPIRCNKTDEIDRLEKTGGEGKAPECGRSLDEKGGKDAESNEKRKVKDDPQEEDPEEEFSWPVPSLSEEIPRRVDEGGDENEDDAERSQGVFNPFWVSRKYQ
jgi:hypothetical protein